MKPVFSNDELARRAGFTLMEILVATLLSAVLMLGLWGVFGLYTALFDSGQAKIDQTQLVRSLFEQLTFDLHSAIQDPVHPTATAPAGTVAARRFGLFGTASELRIDILQLTPYEVSLAPVSNDPQATVPAPLRAPELRTVYYTFVPRDTSSASDSFESPGLNRRELDFETPYVDESATGSGLYETEPLLESDLGEIVLASETPEVVDPFDASVMLAPEVVSLEFRYFDGSSWSSEWDSLRRKSLPAAVGVTLQVANLEDLTQPEASPAVTELDEFADPLAFEETPVELEPRAWPVYSLVIDMPGAPMHRAPRQTRSTGPTFRAPRPIVVRVAPAPRPPSRSRTALWMRNESP